MLLFDYAEIYLGKKRLRDLIIRIFVVVLVTVSTSILVASLFQSLPVSRLLRVIDDRTLSNGRKYRVVIVVVRHSAIHRHWLRESVV